MDGSTLKLVTRNRPQTSTLEGMLSSRLTRRELARYLAGVTAACGLPRPVESQVARTAAMVNGEVVTLGNARLNVRMSTAAGKLRALEFAEPAGRLKLPLTPDVFTLVLAGGRVIKSSEMTLAG